MLHWMFLPLRRYADFSGRSRRMEYWSFLLLTLVVFVVLAGLMVASGLSIDAAGRQSGLPSNPLFYICAGLMAVFWLAILVPSVAVNVRRLHDRDMSGWWYLAAIVVSIVPFVGVLASIALFVITLLSGTPGPNRFGPDPKDPGNVAVFS